VAALDVIGSGLALSRVLSGRRLLRCGIIARRGGLTIVSGQARAACDLKSKPIVGIQMRRPAKHYGADADDHHSHQEQH
jgi:hypothetical protein